MTTTEREPLTAKQAAILAFIVRYWGDHGAAPAIRQMVEHFGHTSPNAIVVHLKPLAAKGYIRLAPRDPQRLTKHRAIEVPELVDAARAAAREYLSKLGGGQQ